MVFSIGLISLLLYWVDWQQALVVVKSANLVWLVAAVLLVIAIVLMDGLRLSWMVPLKEVNLADHLRLALQSAFVLQLGFGIAAGDAYRTVRYAARSGKVLKPVAHIVAARIAGIASIGIVALVISLWVLISADGTAQELGWRIIRLVFLAALIALAIFAGLVLFIRYRYSGIPKWVAASIEAFKSITPRVWALSLFMVLVRGASFGCALYAVGQFVSIYIPVLASSTAALTTLLPLAFGGLGVREGALAGTVVLFGFPYALAISAAIIMRIVVIIASCIGLLVSYVIPAGETRPQVDGAVNETK